MSKKEIDKICKKYNITDYSINKDGSINVFSDVDLSGKKLKKLPLIFERVTGNFNCSDNYLENLIGSPRKIVKNDAHKNKSGDFNCGHNNIITLKEGPIEVSGNYIGCCNDITDFSGFPKPYYGNNVNFCCNPVFEILDLVSPEKQPKFIRFLNKDECDVIRKDTVIYQRLEQAYYMTTKKEDLHFDEIKLTNYKLIE